MVIFHSYVSLQEGTLEKPLVFQIFLYVYRKGKRSHESSHEHSVEPVNLSVGFSTV